MEVILTFEEGHGAPTPFLKVHCTPGCGMSTFKDVAFVMDPDGANPGLQIPKPLGVGAVRRILAELDRRRAAGGGPEHPA